VENDIDQLGEEFHARSRESDEAAL
jgi:hypothetical protein